ncbi:DUF4402 domain-containing protein [Alterisphingorhabdus coralli]|uniref:DUF4402 domain-containing protein n=1 Tax=Alterisphingorhabdus coralli TaxID=3071408 RepID=A0AA97I1V7_9SPHN|nr:DUF4402 domain-containing protein [Parasphingorhabdus sp. SCSIO 66989]WOE75140.1 DUF4402 domain-containing protein [Parasphingorhabdus sp. SCSIO 66989]
MTRKAFNHPASRPLEHLQKGLAIATVAFCIAATPAAAQETGTSEVQIRRAIVIENNQAMDFGRIIPGDDSSSVRIMPENGNTIVNGNAILAGGTISPAQFTVRGTAEERVQITVRTRRVDLARAGGSEVMPLSSFRLDGNRGRVLDQNGEMTFAVGGLLRIAGDQAAGVYSGTFTVTVDYL